jgi:epoxyqueuosine reductase
MKTGMPVKETIQAEAFNLGFSLVGITSLAPPRHLDVYQRWIERGRHGAMAYLSNDNALQRRANPASILPQGRSVILLGTAYMPATLFPPARPDSGYGRVAAYASGVDYHQWIPDRLEKLAARLEEILGHPILRRGYTDTGPILERELGQRAGLGWIGKNTCLISPRHGSFFFLSELFVDQELEADAPITTDHCGSCRRCIEACPTGCILPDRTLDASRCISYLTIENKGPIPPDLRPQVGNWVFGCDVCQMVCPWNLRFAKPGEPALTPRPEVAAPRLKDELLLSPQQFNQKFKNSPVQRARRRGYLRNVAVALGNAADPDTIPPLRQTLQEEPEPLVRGHAAWALGRIGTPAAWQALEAAARQETDAAVRQEIQSSLETS